MSRMSDNPQVGLFQKVVNPTVTDGIIKQIVNAVRIDVLRPGQKLPGEPNLAKQMGVSRNALREALNRLIERGVLFRERGIGTFVTPQSAVLLKTNLSNAVGTTTLITNQGMKPGQTDFSYRFELPSKQVAENMHVSESDEVMHITRVRTADGTPIIASEEYMPRNIPRLYYDLALYANEENWSLYDFLQKADYEIQSVITQVRAVSSDEVISNKLSIEENSPLLCLEQIHFCNEYIKPILYAVNYHNDKMINIMMVRSL